MTDVTIMKPGVAYFDLGQTHKPEVGDVVTIASPTVVGSLVKSKQATKGRMAPFEPRPAVEIEDAPGVVVSTWDDVPDLSAQALKLLVRNAPSADPLTATSEDLLLWLEGSKKRAKLVVGAVDRWKAGLADSEDTDSEGGDG